MRLLSDYRSERGSTCYLTNFLKITLALCPPNPKVLESAARMGRCCALLNVKFSL